MDFVETGGFNLDKILFIGYDGCSTCKKAKKWLKDNGFDFEDRPIKENPPTVSELSEWIPKSGLEIKKWFNTSGQRYRELGLKDKIGSMSEDEIKSLLSSDGMLVKRPIIVTANSVTTGFKEAVLKEILSK